MSLYAMARIQRLNPLELQLAEVHARRSDERSQRRRVRDAAPFTWVPSGVDTDPLALEQRYVEHVAGAFIPKGSGKALHLLVKFPESVPVEEDADAEAALKLAVEFAQAVFGGDAVFSARMDRDERSLTNADLFIAPRYLKKTKHSEKLAISLSRHLKLLAAEHGTLSDDADILRGQGQALQDAFAQFLRSRGYQAIRGQKKTSRDPDWVSPEAYQVATDRKIGEAARQVAAEESAEAAKRIAEVQRERGALKERDHDLRDQEHDFAHRLIDQVERGRELDARDAALDRRQAAIDADRDAVEAKARSVAEDAARVARERAADEEERRRRRAELDQLEADLRDRFTLADREAVLAADERKKLRASLDAAAADSAAVSADRAAAAVDRSRAAAERDAATVHLTRVAEQRLAAERERAAAGLTARQVALVGRALTDKALRIVIEDSPRGVSMDQAAMDGEERAAYSSSWNAVARSVARAVATALARLRNRTVQAMAELRRRHAALDQAIAVNDAERERLVTDRAFLAPQLSAARDFVLAWQSIPNDQRSPTINAAVEKASIFAQAAALSRDGGGTTSKGLAEKNGSANDGHWFGPER